MAKIQVFKLAKEMNIKSNDILTLLKNKGIEVKSHMSVLEDAQVEEIRNSLGAPAKSDGESGAEKPKETGEKELKEKELKKKEPRETGAKEHAEETRVPVKKKKSIIFVSNPHNSKMPGAQIPRKPMNSEKKAAAPQSAVQAAPQSASQNASQAEKTAAPKAEPAAKTETPVNEKVQERPAAAAVKEAAVEVKAAEKTAAAGRPAGAAPEKTPGDRADAGRRYDGQRGDRRDGQRSDNRSDSRGNSRGENRFDGTRRYDGQRGDNRGENRFDNRDRRGENRGDGRGENRSDNRGDRRDGQRYQGGRPGQGFSGGRDGERGRDTRGGFSGRGGNNKGGYVPESPIKDAEKHRDEEKRRISQEKDKKNRKDLMYEEEDGKNLKGGKNRAGKFIKPEKKPEEQAQEQIKVITLPETLTIKELADKMKVQPSAIVKKLFLQGQIVTVNQEIPYETAENIAIEYDIICEQEVKVDVIEELLKEDEESAESMVARPPVICVMGHVDHGKTSLLDAIRKTNVTDKEAGGITQHIGAYTVKVNNQRITFLDTPGHEAFTAMRMRGANSTDIAILVVAADDGVMPQTVEAINHAKAAGIEIIVAVNKIDKPGANIERVKQELTEYGLIAEDWGGSTVFVPVSAKSGEGIDQLLEMILLTAEVLELKANPDRRARGLVIEAELDKGRGPVATILVQKGTLHVGDFVSAGAASGKVRAMIDDKGRRVKEADPSTPVEILGLGDVPNAGEIFIAHENDKEAKYYAETFVAQNKEKLLEDTKTKMSLDDLFSQIQAGNLKELNLIIKADVQGSVEAVKQSLVKLSNEEVVVKCIHGGVGAINESDVILASASNAIIIGFNVRPDVIAKATAEREGVDVRLYKVIYQAIEDIEAAMKGMLDPVFEEKVIGHAEVRQIFRASAVGNIAGSYVLDGTFQRGCKVRITREGEQIYEGALASLKRFKDDVKEVKAGFECGLVFEGFDSMQELDIVEAYIMVEVPR